MKYMKIKLFGKDLFEYNKRGGQVFFESSEEERNKSPYLSDFFRMNQNNGDISDFMVVEEPAGTRGGRGRNLVAIPIDKNPTKKGDTKITPKGIYEMKVLNDKNFKLNVNPKYVDKQIADFKEKLNLIKVAEFDMSNGITEISSVLVRLENRKKYPKFESFFKQYPYTTNSKIAKMTKTHNHLQIGKVEQFLADMPNEAIKEMKEYEKNTKSLCDKKPIFYIIADKKDFKKTEKRRDPILLAQSPFGHVWQILGAWDKEMLLLDEL